jgi:hypothetical protein
MFCELLWLRKSLSSLYEVKVFIGVTSGAGEVDGKGVREGDGEMLGVGVTLGEGCEKFGVVAIP